MKAFTQFLEQKNLSTATIKSYTEILCNFLKHIQIEETQITKPDILEYLKHLKDKQLQNVTRKRVLIILNHYFTHLFEEKQVTENPCWNLKMRGTKRQKLHKIYTPAELQQLFDNYHLVYVNNAESRQIVDNKLAILNNERNSMILNILINQGISVKELNKIEIDDLNLKKLTLTMKGGRTNKRRVIPIKPTQMKYIFYYLHDIYPQLLELQTDDTNKLFLPLPLKKKHKNGNSTRTMKQSLCDLTKQIKSIDGNFTGFHQVRASVITSWLKDFGLRKTQYLSGHYKVFSTERYLVNDLDELTQNINNLHPF